MINFSFETNGKLMVLGVPILKHFIAQYLTDYLYNTTLHFNSCLNLLR